VKHRDTRTIANKASVTEESMLEELRQLFEEADALLSGASCPSSTECCRFGITGREPYLTSIEARAIERAVLANGGPLSKKRRALPLADRTGEERTCPLLTREGRCSVYASRPLGCRTYFCERATLPGPRRRKEERELARRLADLGARHSFQGDQVRPLSRILESPSRST
jgi:Fe-S-cluster containining protein